MLGLWLLPKIFLRCIVVLPMMSACTQILLLEKCTVVQFAKASSMALAVNSMVMIVPSLVAIAAFFVILVHQK
jgi:hypothetical protein